MQGERDPLQTPAAPALPVHERIGLSIIATDAADAVNRIIEAERAGLGQVWLSQGGSGGTDTLTIAAVAAARTTQIRLGTAIVPTYPRHPLVMAQQALVMHDLALGRLRLGIGPSHRPIKAHISTGRDRSNCRPRSLLRGVASSTQREREHHRKSCANQAKTQDRDRNPSDNQSDRESSQAYHCS